MRVDSLYLSGFRNFSALSCSFVPGVNLILGDNAQGKTNLLEAICYLSRGKAFRTRKEAELIGFHSDFAELQAEIFSHGRNRSVRAVMFAGAKPRQLFLGGVKQRSFASMQGLLTTVLFCPEDLTVLKKGAAERRKLLSDALCQLRPKYDTALEEYNRLLQQKNAILKDRFENPAMLQLLPEYNERMAQFGAVLIRIRAKYLCELEKHAQLFHEEFSGGRESLRLTYQTVSTVHDPFAPLKDIYACLCEHQHTHAAAELESRQCLSGPHKDDFDVALNGLSLRAFGSQGQTRTVAISLKLAEREIFKNDTNEEPVLLLDDVLSELDAERQDFVLNKIRSGQVFITCCEKDRLTDIGQVLHIQNGCLTDNC